MLAHQMVPRQKRLNSCSRCVTSPCRSTDVDESPLRTAKPSRPSSSLRQRSVGVAGISRYYRAAVLMACTVSWACQAFVVHRGNFASQQKRVVPGCRHESSSLFMTTETEFPTVSLVGFNKEPSPGVSIAAAPENTIVILSATSDEENDDAKADSEENEARVEEETAQEDTHDEETMNRRRAAATSALFRINKGAARKSGKKLKDTSVGARRVGSATRTRKQGAGSTSQLLGTIRTAAAAAASKQGKQKNATSTASRDEPKRSSKGSSQTVIQSTINELLENQNPSKPTGSQDTPGTSMNHGSMGILGERQANKKQPIQTPGTVLLHALNENAETTREALSIRTATPLDDVDIANLRLSVFSDFSPDVQKQFCYRSCQVLASRRLRGATCLVATVPRADAKHLERQDYVLGSIECSMHEFYGTKLGLSRPEGSILYITEVAVSPRARRLGVGTRLLEGVDKLSSLRNIESLYLHVDVKNVAALKMYEKAGYDVVDNRDPIFAEFTTSLNLHDGATKGRKHFLLQKHLTSDLTWVPLQESCLYGASTLGFDVMA